MRLLFIFNIISLFYFLEGSTPLNFTFGYHAGYDDNVMRFSSKEISDATSNAKHMGGSKTFDSYINKIHFQLNKSLFILKKKELVATSSLNLSNYVNNPNKDYWSGNFSLKYKWGSYKYFRYSLRHLDSYYLRHYIDRDISLNNLEPCSFSDNDQFISFSNKINRKNWYNLGIGFLQRYYDNPFTEFDLDIYYVRFKISQKIQKIGSISFQIDRAFADNITFGKTATSSEFDRSYESLEWYIPLKFKSPISLFDQIGFSIRQELRYYEAEASNDVLHAGRDHSDNKLTIWINKNFSDDLNISLSARFRHRQTNSSYDWVSDLKSFNQVQLWCKIKWGFSYDKY